MPYSSRPFPFVYQCRECGTVEVVRYKDANWVAPNKDRAPDAADAALLKTYRWTAARPEPICPECDE